MSHKTKQAVMSRRSRRADDRQQQQQPAAASMSPKIVSNPIFSCEDGCDRLIPADLYCGYGPGSVHDVADDVPAPAAGGVGKPLPLPPSRTRLPGTRGDGPALVMTSHQLQYGWVMRRVPDDDPFLAAYVACTKTGGEINAAPVKQQRKNEKRAGTFRGFGIWNGGWAAGAKYAGAMSSCKYGRAVTVQQQGDAHAPAAAAQVQAKQASPEEPRLHLSRPLVVIPARKRALARPGTSA